MSEQKQNEAEKFRCLECGCEDVELDYEDKQMCAACESNYIVTESEYNRFQSIKGTFQLYIGGGIVGPVLVHVRHINKMGWIVADVVNTEQTIFPALSHLVEFDEPLYKKLKREYQIAEHKRALEKLEQEGNSNDKN